MKDPCETLFIQRLREAREALDLSQDELASRAELQPSAISHFETGGRRPSFTNLRRLAIELEVSVDWLLVLEDELTPTLRRYRNLDPEDQTLVRALIRRLGE